MSNGYLVAAEADLAAAHDIGDGFGLDVIDAGAIGDREAVAAALSRAPNVGVLVSDAAAINESFLALLRLIAPLMAHAQLIVIDESARAALSFLPQTWPIMTLDEARRRSVEALRRRQSEPGASTGSLQTLDDAERDAPAETPVEPAPAEQAPAPSIEDMFGAPETPSEIATEQEAAKPAPDLGASDMFGAPAPSMPEPAPNAEAPSADSAAPDNMFGAPAPPPAAEPPPSTPQAPPAAAPSPAPAARAPASEERWQENRTETASGNRGGAGSGAPAPARKTVEDMRRSRAATQSPADATAFAPKKLRRATPELVRIVLHQPKDLKDVIKSARQLDPRTEAAPQSMGVGDIAHGASIGVTLDVRGAACDGAQQRRTWLGEPLDFNFSLEAEDVAQVVILARVFVDDAQIGVLAFTRKVMRPRENAANGEASARLKRHKRVFLSYASKDRETVSAIATAYDRAGVEHFWDRASLKSGEEWSPRLLREIDRCDLFHLCWSKSASTSEWVEKEAQHALERRQRSGGKRPDITVQMLDGPPWAPHPPHLDSINFDDFVRAAIVGYARGDGT